MKHRIVSATLLFVVATILLSLCKCNAEKSHNLIVGSRIWGDQQLHKEVIKKDYSWFRVVDKQITFTGDGISKITQIKALDQARDGKGAEVILIAGGPDQCYATLRFESQRSNPIDYIVEIYGKEDR